MRWHAYVLGAVLLLVPVFLIARQPGALIESEEQSLAQTLSLVRDRRVTAIDGSVVPVNAQTVCLHGDGAHALAFARRIRERLEAEGIAVRATA